MDEFYQKVVDVEVRLGKLSLGPEDDEELS